MAGCSNSSETKPHTSPDATVENSVIIPPCIIQEGAVIRNAVLDLGSR